MFFIGIFLLRDYGKVKSSCDLLSRVVSGAYAKEYYRDVFICLARLCPLLCFRKLGLTPLRDIFYSLSSIMLRGVLSG